jgi:putative ABC transport system ATP-binding protein
MSARAVIRARNLVKTYAGVDSPLPVLSGLDLDVRRGEFVVVLGRSGSGKSTLLNLIAAMDRPSAGTIEVDGIDITPLSENERSLFRRRRLGFIFQAYNLIPTLTVRENLELPLALNGDRDTGKAPALLARLGIEAKIDEFPDRLSGGEQQRVAIARALIHGPAVVLADEPTGNLDLDSGRQVLQLLDELVRDAGTTLVMATHSSEVIGHADRILTIERGHLVERS